MDDYISWYDAENVNVQCDKGYYSCGGEVKYVTDPFNYEMNNEVENLNLCEECYKDLIQDI